MLLHNEATIAMFFTDFSKNKIWNYMYNMGKIISACSANGY
jgi:hypothetical protein